MKKLTPWSVYIGFDPRETAQFAVARHSLKRHLDVRLDVNAIVLNEMRREGLYTRPTTRCDGRLFDTLSNAPMSTEFAISRFLTPVLAQRGWALFMDCDMLVLGNIKRLFQQCEDYHSDKALVCVKHEYHPTEEQKMDGQLQLNYARKNWSSMMLFNCEHPANQKLTVELINTVPGRDLHRFCWLEDKDIGEVNQVWNWLVGHSKCYGVDPVIVHHTEGSPCMPGYENVDFADIWYKELENWANS